MCVALQAKKVVQAAAASRSVATPIVSEVRGTAAATSEGENDAASLAERQDEPDPITHGNSIGSVAPHKRQKRTHREHNQQAQGNGSGGSLQQVSFRSIFPGVRVGIGLQIFRMHPTSLACMHMHAYMQISIHTYIFVHYHARMRRNY